MGQRQSRDAGVEEGSTKADYYDLLGVERTATEDELKKAYRRKALELHPDRNYGNVEHATRLFAEIQTAYEVLSDPQERAWYDSHRDVLLRGDPVGGEERDEFSYNIRITTAVEVQKLMLKFNGKLEFTDAPSGFYGGLNDFFRQLAKEEDIACQWEDEDSMDYPDFGYGNDKYEDVVRPFYSAWTGFATRKSFVWKDQYRLSDAPDRRIRRLMEKENKKLREEAIQEFNDSVRSLVAFVRKRDPRVAINQKSEAERQKVLRDAAAAQAARSKAARQRQLDTANNAAAVPEWAQSRFKDEHEGGFSSESEVEEHEYDCVVCDKTFKSEAQFNAHEKSKKHVKLLKQLKRDMREENVELDGGSHPATLVAPNSDDDEYTKELDVEQQETTTNDINDVDGERILEEANKADANDRGTDYRHEPTTTDASDEDYAPRKAVEERLGNGTTESLAAKIANASLDGTPATSDTEGTAQPKIGKAKQKRAKKAGQQATGVTSQPVSEFQCAGCKADFSSKSKLFAHLKEKPSHAALISQMKGSKGGKGKKR